MYSKNIAKFYDHLLTLIFNNSCKFFNLHHVYLITGTFCFLGVSPILASSLHQHYTVSCRMEIQQSTKYGQSKCKLCIKAHHETKLTVKKVE